MHGSTVTVAGRKSRRVADVRAELESFFEIAVAEGVHPGGVHQELAGEDVTEGIGGSRPTSADDLAKRYVTQCDPRLNPSQAADVAADIARLLARRSLPQRLTA